MSITISSPADLEHHYASYIQTLNEERWSDLPSYLAKEVIHNDKHLDHNGYRNLVLPKTHFVMKSCIADVSKREIAARLSIDVEGRAMRENVFYKWNKEWKIERVWSIVEWVE